MKLKDTMIRNIKPTDRTVKLFDGGGLYLQVSPKGGKWWRIKYRFGGKEKCLSLGVYPDVGLKEARERHGEMRKLVANGIDPKAQRDAAKAEEEALSVNTIENIAREWLAKQEPIWAKSHYVKIVGCLKLDLFPWLGKTPITKITAPMLLTVLRRVEARGAIDTAHRLLNSCGQIFRYAIATGRAERDITSDLRGALSSAKKNHFAAMVESNEVAVLLRTLGGYRGSFIVQCALRLAPLVFVRPGELRHARWSEINFEIAEWRLLITKTKTEHIVPLATQSIAILK